jgi:hypothetical protein
MSRAPSCPRDAYRPMVAPWAAKSGDAARAGDATHGGRGGIAPVRVPPVAPGAWASRAGVAPARASSSSPAATPRASDGAIVFAGAAEAALPQPADAAEFERLAVAASSPADADGEPSVRARCAALRALRAGATAAPALPPPGLSGACCAAALAAVLLPWSAAADAEADAASGVPPRDGAPSPSELRAWLDSAERALVALSRCASFVPSELPPAWTAALFRRLRSERTREDEAHHLRALLHWCARVCALLRAPGCTTISWRLR